MSNQLSTYTFETHAIRTITINNEPWFIAKDVCSALGIENNRKALLALDDDEKGVTLSNTLGGQQEMNIVSESGMFTLILRCRDAVKKGSAPHRFRKWVTSEVLPQIRKTGRYEQQQIALPEPKLERKVMLEMTEEEACDLCWLWFSHKMQNQLLNKLIEPLWAIKSEFHSQVYSHSFEYKAFYRAMFEIVDSLAETFKDSTDSNWVRIREHIIEYRLNQRPILFNSRLDF